VRLALCLMCYRIMYGIIYTFSKWCIFIVLSANLLTPLAPSQETFLSTLANISSNMLNFSLPHSTVVWKRYLKVCPGYRGCKKGGKIRLKTFPSLHRSKSCLFIHIFCSQFPLTTLVSNAFPATPL